MGEPVRVQGMISQDRFLGKTQPLEQLERARLLWCHAGHDFRHPHVQSDFERQLQQEPAYPDFPGRLRYNHAKLSDMACPAHASPVNRRIADNGAAFPGHKSDQAFLQGIPEPRIHLGWLGDVPFKEKQILLGKSPGESDHLPAILGPKRTQHHGPALEAELFWKLMLLSGTRFHRCPQVASVPWLFSATAVLAESAMPLTPPGFKVRSRRSGVKKSIEIVDSEGIAP